MKPRILVVIPARYASTRFPGKPLTSIAGRPMIEWVYRRASRARGIDAVWVATDDRRVASAVRAFGGTAILTSRRHRSGTDRIAEVARRCRHSIIVNVQGDEPLMDPRAIEGAVRGFLKDGMSCPVGTLKSPMRSRAEAEDANVVKVVTNAQGEALYFSRSLIPKTRGLDLAAIDFSRQRIFFKHLGLYVYSRSFLLKWPRLMVAPLEKLEALEQLRVLENGYRIKVLETSYSSPSVDTPQDVWRVEEEILRQKIKW